VDTIITALEACDVRVLVNDAIELPSPWHGLWIVGADDTLYGDPQPELALAGVPSDALSIMLAHSPDICEHSILGRCALTLCGHTHGGQVNLPILGSLFMRSGWGKRFPADLHRHNGTHLWVSRGVGTVHLPLRLGASPDVGVFDLHA
jgi:predicted MPP superfamily phosphohydrolase